MEQTKNGTIDSRVEVGDILEMREKGFPTEFYRVDEVQAWYTEPRVIISNITGKEKPEPWVVDELKQWAFYSSRSAESLAPKKKRSMELTDKEYFAVRELINEMRKAK